MDADPSRRARIRLAWHAAVATLGSAAVGASLHLTIWFAVRSPLAPGVVLVAGSLAAAALAVTWAALGRTWGLVLPAHRLGLGDVLSPGMDANYRFVQAVHRGDVADVTGHLDRLRGLAPVGAERAAFADLAGLEARTRRRLALGGVLGVAVASVAVLAVVGLVPAPRLLGDPFDRALVVAAAFAGEVVVLLGTNASAILPWVDAYIAADGGTGRRD